MEPRVVMTGGGSTGPRPHPDAAKTATPDTKHIAAAHRSILLDMSLASVRTLQPDVVTEPGPPWPVALAASLAGPGLLSLAFPKVNLGIFAFIALVPLFLLWSKSSWKQAFWWGLLAGVTLFALLLNWTTNSLHEFVGNWWVLGLVLICLIEGLNVAFMALAISLVCRGEFRATAIFAVAAVWLLGETWRTRGSLGLPFGELGLAAVHLPWLLPIAAYGGVYLLTGVVALVNAALAGIIDGTPPARRTGLAVLCVLAVLIVTGDVLRNRVTLPPAHVRVGIAQGNISQVEKWSPAIFAQTISIYATLTHQAAARGAKVVVWPETAVTGAPLQDPLLLRTLETLAQQSNVWIIAGTIDRPTKNTYYNAMLDLSPAGTMAGVYRKRLLVPWAEYLPLASLLDRLPIMREVSGFSAGAGPRLLPAAGFLWGALICFESAFAPYARATANAGADAIVVATDDAWFAGTTGPRQHGDIAIVDAISTGRWIVRGAATGISMIISPKGDVIAELPMGTSGTIVGDVGRGIETPYDRFGIMWLLLLSALAIVAAAVRPRMAPSGWRSRRGAP
jgi:apolipoprotein N-acyltransferase